MSRFQIITECDPRRPASVDQEREIALTHPWSFVKTDYWDTVAERDLRKRGQDPFLIRVPRLCWTYRVS
jgi:hypothetical protein